MDVPVHNPSIPYSGYIQGGFGAGRTLRIQGTISPSVSHFTINLQCGSSMQDDIALHFNPRFHENAIIRNARSYSSWGNEERHGGMPLVRGQNFEIMILSEAQRYMIAINGQHFTEFNQRVPSDRVNYLTIEGDLTVSLIQFGGASAPSYNPSAPIAAAAPYPSSNAPYPPMGLVAPTGGSPYPQTAPGYPQAGPGYPPAGGPGYAPAGGAAYLPPGGAAYPPVGGPGYPQGPPPPAYGSTYPQPGGYPPPPAYPTQPGYAQGPGPYPGAYPQGGYPPPQGYPGQHKKSGGLLDNAGKLIGAGLAGVGLAGVANKVGIGGHGHGHGHGPGMGMGHAPGHSSGGGIGGILGPAAALGVGGLVAGKAMKKGKKKNKLLKYGLPLAGVGVGGYALSKGMKHAHKGFGHHGRSSSSSSSSSYSDSD